jgi:hypothetical protein
MECRSNDDDDDDDDDDNDSKYKLISLHFLKSDTFRSLLIDLMCNKFYKYQACKI